MSNDDLGWQEGEYGMEPVYPNPIPEQEEPNVCNVDMDDAFYLGDGDDGVYFDAAEEDGKWYTSAVVDTDTGAYCGDMVTDDGPYESKYQALIAGLNTAADWCMMNMVDNRYDELFEQIRQDFEPSPEPGWVSDPNFGDEDIV